MKTLLLLFALAIPAAAAPTPVVEFLPVNTNTTEGSLDAALTMTLSIYGDDGALLSGQPIDIKHSAAASTAGIRVVHGDASDPVRIASVTALDNDRNGFARMITIKLDPAAPQPDTSYRVSLHGAGNKPALTIRGADSTDTVIREKAPFKVGLSDADVDWLKKFNAFKPSLSVSGGDDGTLFDIHIRRAWLKIGGHRTNGAWIDLQASLTPDLENTDNPLYGKLRGEFSLFHQRPWRKTSMLDGQVIFAAHGLYESDQNFDVATASAGAGLWMFMNCAALEDLSDALCLSGDVQGHPVALQLAYDHVFHAETAGTPAATDGNNRLRARLLWPARIFEDVDLPFTGRKWNADLELDATAVWDFDSGDVHPDLRATLAFSPVSEKEQNLAFTLTWAHGEISPTFADADAFLAGLRLRF